MEEEAMILYALTHGHLDSIPVENLKKFEDELYRDMKSNARAKEIATGIRDNKALPDFEVLDEYFKDFKKRFI